MTTDDAKRILGPIRMYYSRTRKTWCLDQKPATIPECKREAKRIQRKRAIAKFGNPSGSG